MKTLNSPSGLNKATELNMLFSRNLADAETFRKSAIPTKLIKFFSLSNSGRRADMDINESKFSILSNEELRFARAEDMNDPYEFQGMYIDKEVFLKNGHSEDDIASYNEILRQQKCQWALTSLSGNTFDCLPMWAYYTNEYQGYCVEYDVLKPDAIFKIWYEPIRIPIAFLIATLFHDYYTFKGTPLSEPTDDMKFHLELLKQQFFLKHDSWRHENEYRIIYPIVSGSSKNVSIKKVGLKTSRIVSAYTG